MGRRLFSNLKEEPTQVERENRRKEEAAPAGSGRELQTNFLTFCFQPGTPGAWVIYGPCQVEGGEKRRGRGRGEGGGEGGPGLGLRLGNGGAERSHRSSPISAGESTHHCCFYPEWEESRSETSRGNGVEALFYFLHKLFHLPDAIQVTDWPSFPEESLEKARGGGSLGWLGRSWPQGARGS